MKPKRRKLMSKKSKPTVAYKKLYEVVRTPVVLTDLSKGGMRQLLLASEAEILAYAAALPGAQRSKDYVFIPSIDPNPMMIVAHVDTVRSKPLLPSGLAYQNGVFSTCDGDALGADDRAGVYAVLRLREMCLAEGVQMPHILLTDGEESGGIGVRACIKDGVLAPWMDDVTLMLEFDRAGADEAVTYSGDLPPKTKEYLKSWGWRLGHGSYTDIATLITEYETPGVNLSVGYYNQHTDKETLVVRHLEGTIETAFRMLKSPFTIKEKQKEKVFTSYGYGKSGYGHLSSWDSPARDLPVSANYGGKIDMVLDSLYHCPDCDDLWHSCECGAIAQSLVDALSDAELLEMMDDGNGYFMEGDPPIAEICKLLGWKNCFEEEEEEEDKD